MVLVFLPVGLPGVIRPPGDWDLSIEHRTGVRTPLVSSQNSGSPCTQTALSPKGWKNEVLLGLVDSFPPQSEALMVGTLSSAFPGLSKLQLPTDKVRVSKFTVSGLRVVELHTTSGAGAPGAGPYAFAPVHPKLCLASFLPLGVRSRTYLPPASRSGVPGAAQEGRSIPAGSCLAQPRRALGARGQGEVQAVAALVTRQDAAGPGWAPNEEEGGRGGAPGGRTLRVVRREEFGGSDVDCEPGLCGGGVWWGRLLPPSLPRVPSVRQARHGDAVAPCPRGRAGQEAAPGGAAEGPTGACWVSQMPSRAPAAKLASEGGGRAGGGPLRVSSDISRVWESSCSAEPGQRAGVIVPEAGWSQH